MEIESLPSTVFSSKAKSDLKLVAQAQHGDQKAFAVLLQRYRESVFYTISRMVRNAHDAEDLTMDSFGKAFRNIRFYKPINAFSTWLFKIATNNAIDFIRSNRLRTVSIDEETENEEGQTISTVPQILEESSGPEESMIREQKEKMMWQIVQQLPDDYRSVTIKRYFEEKAYVEIAEELDIPIGTVKARLYRSRELLLAIIKDNNMHHDEL